MYCTYTAHELLIIAHVLLKFLNRDFSDSFDRRVAVVEIRADEKLTGRDPGRS
jgi:hypothetical protein